MSLIQFSIESSGEKAIIRDFENRWKQSQNLSKPLEDFANYFEREIQRNFESSGSGFGGWKRRKKAYSHPILQKTRKMQKGFRHTTRSQEVEFSNLASYFKFHQLGTRKLPVRKMWGVREMDWQELRQQIQKYLFEESR